MVKPINDKEAVKLTILGLEVSENFLMLTPCTRGLSIAAVSATTGTPVGGCFLYH